MLTNGGPTSQRTSLQADLDALAQLPPELKELVWHAPVNLDAQEILLVWKRFGPSVVPTVVRAIYHDYPNWPGPLKRKKAR